MKRFAPLMLLLLGACQTGGVAENGMTDKDRVIAAITEAGCKMDPSNADAISSKLGLSDEKLRQIGKELVDSGQADVSTFGIFKLTTGACA